MSSQRSDIVLFVSLMVFVLKILALLLLAMFFKFSKETVDDYLGVDYVVRTVLAVIGFRALIVILEFLCFVSSAKYRKLIQWSFLLIALSTIVELGCTVASFADAEIMELFENR